MNKPKPITLIYFAGLFLAVAYKFVVHEEPWAIGMSQVLALWLIFTAFYFAALRFTAIKALVSKFFNSEESPVNIAVFRIIFFGWLLLFQDGEKMLWFSQLPKDLQLAPMGMGWLLPHLPINPTIAVNALVLFKFFCLLSMLGFATRVSTILAAVTGFYVIGVPQFYGSVAHNHHLFWILVIFAASLPADTLSIDAVFKGFKRSDRNDYPLIPGPSVTYALPLRFIWVLMGLCYFFPGFWKLWNSGTAWILGDNLKLHMFYNWMGFDGWLPSVRIDQYSWLCRAAAVGVIFFEMSFVFLIFSKAGRYFVFFGGLLFHNLTRILMNIDFYVLQFCYASFLDWNTIFHWIGRRLFPEPMIVLFDGSCSFCRRAIAFLQTFDIFGRIQYQDLHGPESQRLREVHKFSNEVLMKDMHGVIGNQISKGFGAYQRIAARIPLLWPICPFLFIGFVQSIGDSVYRRIADSRACKLTPRHKTPIPEPSNKVLIITATILIAGNVIYGFMGKGSGWPFACYPTFSEIAWNRYRSIECQVVFPDGKEETVRMQSLKKYGAAYRISSMMGKIFSIKDEQLRTKKFLALWEVFVKTDPKFKDAKTVRFYFAENDTDPANWHLNPLERKLAFEFTVNP